MLPARKHCKIRPIGNDTVVSVFTALFTRVFVVDEKLCAGLKNHPENRADRDISSSFFNRLQIFSFLL